MVLETIDINVKHPLKQQWNNRPPTALGVVEMVPDAEVVVVWRDRMCGVPRCAVVDG